MYRRHTFEDADRRDEGLMPRLVGCDSRRNSAKIWAIPHGSMAHGARNSRLIWRPGPTLTMEMSGALLAPPLLRVIELAPLLSMSARVAWSLLVKNIALAGLPGYRIRIPG